MDITIILLHGLGAHPVTLWPLELYLRWCGYTAVHRVSYPVDQLSTQDAVDHVSRRIAELTSARQIVVVGQSFGGIVGNRLHERGWDVRLGVWIGSPLHGARLLTQLSSALPARVWDFVWKPPYDYLMTKSREPVPPHDVHTISMGWPLWNSFDGCVYADEATLDPRRHTHLGWADHRTVFANPRLWMLVARLIRERADLAPRHFDAVEKRESTKTKDPHQDQDQDQEF